jgi:subtilisin family serine protease
VDENCIERIVSEDYTDFLTDYTRDLESLKNNQNICFDLINENIAVIYINKNLILPNALQVYGYRVFPRCFGLSDINSLESSGINRLRNIPTLDLQGQDILIGVIDTGIEYTHDAFKLADGTSKIVSIWDQTIQTGPPPQGFFYGTEYTMEQINEALQSPDPLSVVPSTDENGHGTLLAGIAAGNVSQENNFSGVAPQAQLMVVKLKPAKKFIRDFYIIPYDVICFQENDIMFAAKYLTTVAARLKKPIAICVGIGTSQGAHDARGFLSSYLTSLASNNLTAVVVAAGNEGSSGHHYLGSINAGAKFDTVELKVGPNVAGFTMELWGDAPNTFSIDILSPTGEFIPRIPARLGESRVIRFIFEKTVINVDYEFFEAQTGAQLILMRFHSPTEGIWRFQVYKSLDLASRFHIWLPMRQFLSTETHFVRPDPNYTLTQPANTLIPINVTAYDHTNQSLYLNASRGYARDEIISPAIAAPGVNLIGPGLNNSYTTASGTSLAAAHVTGTAAMLLEWGYVKGNYPQISSVEIKNLLIRGAKRDPNLTYPNREWGYGILDIYNSFITLRGE